MALGQGDGEQDMGSGAVARKPMGSNMSQVGHFMDHSLQQKVLIWPPGGIEPVLVMEEPHGPPEPSMLVLPVA